MNASLPAATLPVHVGSTIRMTSLEIADLVESRHDKVKLSIKRLANRGVIEFPPMGEIPTATKPTAVYIFEGEQGKRDSIVVVAQLSPEFTARLVDRWQELEHQVKQLQVNAKPIAKTPKRRLPQGTIDLETFCERFGIATPIANVLEFLTGVIPLMPTHRGYKPVGYEACMMVRMTTQGDLVVYENKAEELFGLMRDRQNRIDRALGRPLTFPEPASVEDILESITRD